MPSTKKVADFILVIGIILFAFLSPIGSIVTGTHYPYQARDEITFTQNDVVLKSAISLIPKGSTVLIRGNMPQLSTGYKWVLPYQLNVSDLPQYAIADTSSYFYNNSVPISPPVYSDFNATFNYLLGSWNYIILVHNSGVELIKLSTS